MNEYPYIFNHCFEYADRCSGALHCLNNRSLLDEPKAFSMNTDKGSTINVLYVEASILPEYITNIPRAPPEMQPDTLT